MVCMVCKNLYNLNVHLISMLLNRRVEQTVEYIQYIPVHLKFGQQKAYLGRA